MRGDGLDEISVCARNEDSQSRMLNCQNLVIFFLKRFGRRRSQTVQGRCRNAEIIKNIFSMEKKGQKEISFWLIPQQLFVAAEKGSWFSRRNKARWRVYWFWCCDEKAWSLLISERYENHENFLDEIVGKKQKEVELLKCAITESQLEKWNGRSNFRDLYAALSDGSESKNHSWN